MKDHFKQYVQDNRDQFETNDQDFQQMWSEIDKGLDENSRPQRYPWFRIAATLLLLAMVGWMTLSYQMADQMPLELQESEQHYFSLIQVKMDQVTAHRDVVDAKILEDLEILDREYELLKQDLMENFDQEEVAEAMIKNQRTKLEVLEQILDEIQSKEEEDEPNQVDI